MWSFLFWLRMFRSFTHHTSFIRDFTLSIFFCLDFWKYVSRYLEFVVYLLKIWMHLGISVLDLHGFDRNKIYTSVSWGVSSSGACFTMEVGNFGFPGRYFLFTFPKSEILLPYFTQLFHFLSYLPLFLLPSFIPSMAWLAHYLYIPPSLLLYPILIRKSL